MDAVIPELSFASYSADSILGELIAGYESVSGRSLGQADPVRLFLAAIATAVIQERFLLDDSAKQNLLKYSRDAVMDALGDLVGVTRLPAAPSKCDMLISLSIAPGDGNSVTIPAGVRVTKPGSGIYWTTDVDLVISGMDGTGTASATCQTAGATTNGYALGELNVLVDPIAEVDSVSNSTITAGGSDAESDDNLRERIRLAPTAFSGAGPRDAYVYWARSASASIVDVSVVSPSAGSVDVYILLKDGGLPDDGMIAQVSGIIGSDTVRPLTDNVTVKAPSTVPFAVDVWYYINSSDESSSADIQSAIQEAVSAYVAWQVGKIGRDVNPSELVRLMMNAGAKRVVVNGPAYTAVGTTEVAQVSAPASLTYKGLEDE